MRRSALAALLLGAMAVAAVAGQVQDGLQLELAPATLPRGRTAVLVVTIRIPEGRFVPAETRGAIHGAWLQPDDSSVPARQLPTFPSPERREVAGLATPILAYTGTITVRLPIDVLPGIEHPLRVGLEFGYQLCDETRCAPPRVARHSTQFPVVLPSPPEATLAFRADADHVVVMLGRTAEHDRSLPTEPLAARVMPLMRLPDGHAAMTMFTAQERRGARRVVMSNGAAFEATAEQPAALAATCEDTMPLAFLARISDPRFARERAKYYLAFSTESAARPRVHESLTVADALSPARRRLLEQVINDQMQATLPSVFAPKTQLIGGMTPPVKTDFDRRLENGEGHLSYHLETFKLAPDGDPRLFVRAFWTIRGRSYTGMTLWIRSQPDRYVVEQTDASVTRFSRFSEMAGDPLIAANPGSQGLLLNVVPAEDGWAYVLISRSGYEYFGVAVWKYSPLGPVATGVTWGYGC